VIKFKLFVLALWFGFIEFRFWVMVFLHHFVCHQHSFSVDFWQKIGLEIVQMVINLTADIW